MPATGFAADSQWPARGASESAIPRHFEMAEGLAIQQRVGRRGSHHRYGLDHIRQLLVSGFRPGKGADPRPEYGFFVRATRCSSTQRNEEPASVPLSQEMAALLGNADIRGCAGRSALTVLAKLLRYETDQEYEIVQRAFAEQQESLQNAPTFDRWVHDGLARREPRTFDPKLTRQAASGLRELLQTYQPTRVSADQLEICFQADASVFDGRFANLSWLQEVPDPITKLTWDNAALMSARDGVRPESCDRRRSSTVTGRSERGGPRADPTRPRRSQHHRCLWVTDVLRPVASAHPSALMPTRSGHRHTWPLLRASKLEPLGKRHQFAFAQQYDRLDDRDIAREQTIEEFTQRAES